MSFKRLFIFVIVFVSVPSFILAQESLIRGTVVEKSTGEPLVGVNVYLAGSSIGASSKLDGGFAFSAPLQGRFDLVASFLGFKSSRKEIFIQPGDTLGVRFELEENLLLLDELQVSASRDKDWQRKFDNFRRFFLGWDDFANQCTITNPAMIDFAPFGDKQLLVTFREPLEVQNHALGYTVTLEAGRIIFNPYDHTGFWTVYPRFEPMETENRRQRRDWERSREKAYLGSSKHFMISLKKDELKRDKFILLPRSNAIQKVEQERLIQQTYRRDWQQVMENYNVFRIANVNFGVAYDPEYTRAGKIVPGTEINAFEVQNQTGVFAFDEFGNLFNPDQVIFYGQWSEDRYAKTLPVDYVK